MFNLVEIRSDNSLQVRDKITEGSGDTAISYYHRRVVKSTDDLSDQPEIVKTLAAAFPYDDSVKRDGVNSDVEMIRILADENKRAEVRYDEVVSKVSGGKVVASERKQPKIANALDDLSTLPSKVQQVAAIIFTDSVKATEQAKVDAIVAEKERAEVERVRVAAERETAKQEAEATAAKAFSDAVAAEVSRLRA
ncbi:hypothetical protein OAA60_00730 [Porticoccaceae bacterium]|nr:hypothetical protein [Porticoccaceae bacterium]